MPLYNEVQCLQDLLHRPLQIHGVEVKGLAACIQKPLTGGYTMLLGERGVQTRQHNAKLDTALGFQHHLTVLCHMKLAHWR